MSVFSEQPSMRFAAMKASGRVLSGMEFLWEMYSSSRNLARNVLSVFLAPATEVVEERGHYLHDIRNQKLCHRVASRVFLYDTAFTS